MYEGASGMDGGARAMYDGLVVMHRAWAHFMKIYARYTI